MFLTFFGVLKKIGRLQGAETAGLVWALAAWAKPGQTCLRGATAKAGGSSIRLPSLGFRV